MKKHEIAGGFLWLILGIGFCIGSLRMGLGNLHKPGPGFMPFWAGAFLGLSGIALSVAKMLNGRNKKKEEITHGGAGEKINYEILLSTLAALFCYALLLQPVGFYTTTTLFLFFLFKLSAPKKWIMPLVSTIITVVLSYVIFSLLLNIQFPSGITGF